MITGFSFSMKIGYASDLERPVFAELTTNSLAISHGGIRLVI